MKDMCALSDFGFRSDVSGALSIVLENAPYGPNAEDAKVRILHACCAMLFPDNHTRYQPYKHY